MIVPPEDAHVDLLNIGEMRARIAAFDLIVFNLLSFDTQSQQPLSTPVQGRPSGQNVAMPDGQILPFEDVPVVKKFRGLTVETNYRFLPKRGLKNVRELLAALRRGVNSCFPTWRACRRDP